LTDQARIDTAAVRRLADAVPAHWKGAPLGKACRLSDSGRGDLDALGGDLPLPLLLLRQSALDHNITRMARFVATEGVLLAPHAKTTMSPQLIERQVKAGCWAITAATPFQLDALRRMGIQRIILANQLVEPAAIRWVSRELSHDRDFEFICLVDSPESIERLDRGLQIARAPRCVGVLVEVGVAGGRAGARTFEQALEVAEAAHAASALELLGVECYEGLLFGGGGASDALARVDDQLELLHAVAGALRSTGMVASPIVSAGGSAFFDRVLACFPRPLWRVVLRSGCYITQDGGFYNHMSPLAGRGHDPNPLRDALELWGVVLSRPEPGVAVAGVGKRDAPFDLEPPRPVAWRSADSARAGDITDATVLRLDDQHVTFAIATTAPSVGDLVRFVISHPCGAFDRWRVIPVVDDSYRIVDTIHTLF
jgi:D-serine dehydratase